MIERMFLLFLFPFKSKCRRKWTVFAVVATLTAVAGAGGPECSGNGLLGGAGAGRNDSCACFEGWQGPQCQFCAGKVRLWNATGTIHDGAGNYSLTSKCSWLIDAPPNSTIVLHVEEFATECGWDHLYVFDGDGVDAPLLAVFSGLMYKKQKKKKNEEEEEEEGEGYYGVRRVPEVVARSGAALLHFFSDDAYNMSGFNVTYRLNGCPSTISSSNCSGHGVCIEGACTCDGRWTGAACHLEKCPSNCGAAEDRGSCEPERGCLCFGDYKGADCGQRARAGWWEAVAVPDFTPNGTASHGAAVWMDSMYVVAGESYGRGALLSVYDFNGNVWETPHVTTEGPSLRYGHSTVLYGDKIYMYGGVATHAGPVAELWAFDVSAKTWENVTVKSDSCNESFIMCGPLKSAGHTATLVRNGVNRKIDRMIVVFGLSPKLGYLNSVQEYYFGTREWHIVNTKGYPVKGGYGHSADWDETSGRIYVYGGVVSESESSQYLSKSLYAYEPNERSWTMLAEAPSARYLHSATFVTAGMMLVFGGNTHNDTSSSFGAKCYSAEMLAYDVSCDAWRAMRVPEDVRADSARFGHSAVTFAGSLYVYGGFDGQMLSDLLKYTPGDCAAFADNETSCLNALIGAKCVWDSKSGRCVGAGGVPRDLFNKKEDNYIVKCPKLNRSAATSSVIRAELKCEEIEDCLSCVHTTSSCIWCGGDCVHSSKKCTKNAAAASNNDSSTFCSAIDPLPICKQLHTCRSCTAQPSCRWRFEHARCLPHSAPAAAADNSTTATTDAVEQNQCQNVCSEYNSCLNCTQEECIWCQNEGRCVDKNAYTSSFPYGQCREWTTVQNKCRTREGGGGGGGGEDEAQCGFYKTCAKCRDDPGCGWCDDGSRTGLGTCMPGGYAGPTLHTHSLPLTTCPPARWHFTHCPACQCNGHAVCKGANNGSCAACADLTTGAHCERCARGYWGSPVNGGKCAPCQCNRQAEDCHGETGKCFCTTKGIAGDQCEKCDTGNHYHPDPNNKSCYYDLTIDYQFTFNLSKKEDRHYTQINFRNSPIKSDIDADFLIQCSVAAKMNVTVRTENSAEEKPIFENYNCTSFRSKFAKSLYKFGLEENVTSTTFYVYVYDFQTPLWIQISFSQYPKLNLQQFFITFSSCFLLLLLVAAVLWKIKQRYDLYRRRQRLFVEMEQMASRPFSQVLVELEVKEENEDDEEEEEEEEEEGAAKRRKKRAAVPSPIALEPCFGNRAAVLSLLVRLPTGGEAYTVKGQAAGLAIASALVTLGNPRKMSADQIKGGGGETKGGKIRKSQSQHPDSCL